MTQNNSIKRQPVILIAEDDPDDRLLIEHAFQAGNFSDNLFFVEDGEELLDYLLGRKQYSENGPAKPICLILDLKMPRRDGREALKEIRKNPEYSDLPIVILSTSDSENDKEYCFRLGVSDYLIKPDNFAGLLSLAEKTKKVCMSHKKI